MAQEPPGKRKWAQEPPSLFPIDFLLVLIRISKGNAHRIPPGVFPIELPLVLIRKSKGNGSRSSQAYFLLIFHQVGIESCGGYQRQGI